MTSHDTHENSGSDMQPRNDDFDRAARRHHTEALTRLSPQTQARLRAARHAAAARVPERRGLGWMLAGSCASVFAIAIAVQLQRAPPGIALPEQLAVDSIDSGVDSSDGARVDSLIAALDENPDLYLWLAANDDTLPPPSEQWP